MSILHTPTSSISSLAPDSPSPMSANGAQQQLTPITDSEGGYEQKPASATPSVAPPSASGPTTNGNGNSTSTTAGAPAQKRKPSRRANTAERRATHNAVERQRRETLNGRFLDLAALLPNLASVRRPSKSAIVNSSIALILSARRQRVVAAKELRGVLREADALRRECNEWRERAGVARCESPQRSAELGAVLSAGEGVEEYAVGINGGMPPMPMTPGGGVQQHQQMQQQGQMQQMQQQQHEQGMMIAGTQGWWEPENMGAMGEEERRAYELVMRATSGEDGGDEDEDMDDMYGAAPKFASAAPYPQRTQSHGHGHGQRQSSAGSSFGGFEGASPSGYDHHPSQHLGNNNGGYAMEATHQGQQQQQQHGPQLDKFGNWTTQAALSNPPQSQWAHTLPSSVHGGASPTSSGGSPVHGHHVPHALSSYGGGNANGRVGAGGVGLFTPPGTASGGSPLHPSSSSEDALIGGDANSVGSGSPGAGAAPALTRGSGNGATALGLGGLGGMGFGGIGVDQWGMPLLNGAPGGGMNGGMNGMNGMGGMNNNLAGRGGMMMAMM